LNAINPATSQALFAVNLPDAGAERGVLQVRVDLPDDRVPAVRPVSLTVFRSLARLFHADDQLSRSPRI
jgi:hypothetical protein